MVVFQFEVRVLIAFVVNIPRSHLRREFMEMQLSSLGLNYSIPDGIDYRCMSDSEFYAMCSSRALQGDNCLRGIFAASLSHLQIYSHIVDMNFPFALILEDDVCLSGGVIDLLERIEETLPAGAVCLLRYYSSFENPLKLTLRGSIGSNEGCRLLPPVDINSVASAAAYVVTRDFACKMLDRFSRVDHAPDNWGFFFQGGAFDRLFCHYPQIVHDAAFVPVVEYPSTRTFFSRFKSALRRFRFLNNLAAALHRPADSDRHKIRLCDDDPFWLRSV